MFKDFRIIIIDIVFFSEINFIGNMFGGELFVRMDRVVSIFVRRYSRCIVVMVFVNYVVFNKMIFLGSVVMVEVKILRVFNSFMEVFMDVWIEDRESGFRSKVNEVIYIFVVVDEMGSLVKVFELILEILLEKECFIVVLCRK